MGNRLTERTDNGVAYIGKHTKMPGLESASSMRVAAVRDVMQRLAEYEDTGLDPEQIKEMLKETEPAEIILDTQTICRNIMHNISTIFDRDLSDTPPIGGIHDI